jgi:hypothetical protein
MRGGKMVTKIIEAYCAAFPMYGILLGTVIIVIVSAFYCHYKLRSSIEVALLLQFIWFLVPILLCLVYLSPFGIERKILETAGHMGSGVVFGQILAFGLYVTGMSLKKVLRFL